MRERPNRGPRAVDISRKYTHEVSEFIGDHSHRAVHGDLIKDSIFF